MPPEVYLPTTLPSTWSDPSHGYLLHLFCYGLVIGAITNALRLSERSFQCDSDGSHETGYDAGEMAQPPHLLRRSIAYSSAFCEWGVRIAFFHSVVYVWRGAWVSLERCVHWKECLTAYSITICHIYELYIPWGFLSLESRPNLTHGLPLLQHAAKKCKKSALMFLPKIDRFSLELSWKKSE